MCKFSINFNIEGNTRETSFLYDFTVHSLINTTHKQWNADLILLFFWSSKADLIYHVFNENQANAIINTSLEITFIQ